MLRTRLSAIDIARGEAARHPTAVLVVTDHPALTAVHAAELAAPQRADGDALPFELAFGVDRFLDGIEGWVAAKSGDQALAGSATVSAMITNSSRSGVPFTKGEC
jgi:hypothetical protein